MSQELRWPSLQSLGFSLLTGSANVRTEDSSGFAGYDLEKKCIVEQETDSPTVEHISGMALLDNNGVNLLTAFFMCILTPRFALVAWAKFALK